MSQHNLRRLIIKNTGVQMFAQMVSLGLGFATSFVLSRHLGVDGFGGFNYIFAFFYFFQTINDLGINTIIVREVSKQQERADEIIGAMLSFKVLLAIASVFAAWVSIWLMNFSSELKTSLYIFSLILPILALQLPTVIFQVLLKAEYTAAVGIFSRCFGFALMMVSVWLGYGLITLVSVQIVAEVVALLLLLLFARKFTRPRWHMDTKLWKSILQSSIPLGLAGIFVALINRLDFLMLERMCDMNQVGLYAACYKVTSMVETLPLMIMGTIYPLMSRYAHEDTAKLRMLYNRSVLYLGAIALPIGLGVTFFAPLIIRILFGNRFTGAEQGLRILIWSTVFLYVALCGGNLLISLGKEKVNLLLNISGAAINIGLNLILIPSRGYVGAALATAITYLFILIGVSVTSYTVLQSTSAVTHLARIKNAKA